MPVCDAKDGGKVLDSLTNMSLVGDGGVMAYGLLVTMQWESESSPIQQPNTTCPL